MINYFNVFIKFKSGEGLTLYIAKANYESFDTILKNYFGNKYEDILHYVPHQSMTTLLVTDNFIKERMIELIVNERYGNTTQRK